MPNLCYDCNRQVKGKLKEENKTNTFFHVCLACLSDEKKENRKHILLRFNFVIA